MEINIIYLIVLGVYIGVIKIVALFAYKTLKSKLDTSKYEIEKIKLEKTIDNRFDNLNNEIDYRIKRIMNRMDNRRVNVDVVLEEVREAIKEADGKIDNRTNGINKMRAIIKKLEKSLVK